MLRAHRAGAAAAGGANPVTDSTARLPWWKKKRWGAALALWLAVAYPLSLGPIAYMVGRGWLPVAQIQGVYAPLLVAADYFRPHPGIGLAPNGEGGMKYIPLPDPDPSPRPVEAAAEGYLDAVEWFAALGQRHAAD